MNKLRQYFYDVHSTFWFVPGLIILGAITLAIGLIEASALVDQRMLARWPLLFGAGAAGSRGLLAAIASSMITVAGVVFSITIVALSLASSQYTSRVLRNFMCDRINQTVLGVFVGIFAYCLVVLRTIRAGDEGAFVPSLAMLIRVGLGVRRDRVSGLLYPPHCDVHPGLPDSRGGLRGNTQGGGSSVSRRGRAGGRRRHPMRIEPPRRDMARRPGSANRLCPRDRHGGVIGVRWGARGGNPDEARCDHRGLSAH